VLSILIPIFNRDIRDPVKELHGLAKAESLPFEIICLDDGSREEIALLNQEILALEAVQYVRLERNIGRAAIRNLLADMSKFDFLLFMDADFQILHSDYLKRYLACCSANQVVVGGSLYPPHAPGDPGLFLRWRYGTRREQLPLSKRRRMGWRAFTTHHFFIPRAAFSRVRFDESLRNYGHEDTLFGQDLKAAGFTLLHIDNPLMHQELDPAEAFLEKVRHSVQNLYDLHAQGKTIPSSLWGIFVLLRMTYLYRVFGKWSPCIEPVLRRQLLGPNPKLWVLDLYKVLKICAIAYAASTTNPQRL
jgi:glycosyltransferase involved in cell wall biosynthesis